MTEQDRSQEAPQTDTTTQHTVVTDPAEDYKVDGPEIPHHDDEDVPAALERETHDGKGGAVVPPADFQSYTDPSADKQEDDS